MPSARRATADWCQRPRCSRPRRLLWRALALDDDLAAAHDLNARILFAWDWDWSRSEEEFRRAIELNPNYPDVHVVYAQLLRITGRVDAALAAVHRGLELDPYNAWFEQQLAWQISAAGRHAEATARLQALLAAQPGYPPAHEELWTTLQREGRPDEALHHAIAFIADPELAELLAGGYAIVGYAGAMRRAAEMLVTRSASRYVSPMHIARYYAHAGDTPQVLEWLGRAVDAHDTQIVYAAMRPDFEELWPDPRFRAIMRRINLPG